MAHRSGNRPRRGPPASPRGLTVNRVDLARLLGVYVDRVTKYVGEGMPVAKAGGRGKESEFDAVECLAWWRARRAPGTTEQERTRYFKASADKIEQEVRKRAGELIEDTEVDQRWAGMVAAMRERMLALATVALQRKLIRAEDEDELIRLVDDALSELAQRGDRAERP